MLRAARGLHGAGVMWAWVRVLAVGLLSIACGSAHAVTVDSFEMDDGTPVIMVHGEFALNDDPAALVKEVLATGATSVSFNSGGGNVSAAMKFGRAIRLLGLSTFQIRAVECSSACALAFLGGVRRFAQSGAIGVHRSSFDASLQLDADTAVASIQEGVANTMAYLIEMGVDPRLMQLSLTVDSSDMRYLTSAEMAEHRVTTDDSPPTSPSPPVAARPEPSTPDAFASTEPSFLPRLEETARRDPNEPDRVALYNGLDFLGRDIDMRTAADGPSCAVQCLEHGKCRAFTFNTRTAVGRGPNCFLKSGQGDLDGNSAAVSGRILSRLEPDATSYNFGTIDPNTALYRDRDIPGYDLSPQPLPGVETEFQCRIACVNEATCAAFTFVRPRSQCWLKGAVGDARPMVGAVTGVKSASTFSPTHVPLQ